VKKGRTRCKNRGQGKDKLKTIRKGEDNDKVRKIAEQDKD
jgi:hypothetical protein